MDVEIVLDQNDLLGACEVEIGQILQDVSVVHGGVAIGDLDMAPAFERSKHHEEIGGAIRTRNRNGPGVPLSSGSARAFRQ